MGILDIYHSAPSGEELRKSMMMEVKDKNQPKSAIINPLESMGLGGTREKPTSLSYMIMRRMAHLPAISAVIQTRLNQVARFAKRPRFEGDMGFKIILKDINKKMTEAQKKRAFEIEEFFLKTGAVRNKIRKDNFDTFLRKITRDSLELDAMTFEKVGSLKGNLTEVWAIDGATIELVANNPVGEGGELPVYEPYTKSGLSLGSKNIAYVQRIDGMIRAEFSEDELAYAIRNPRTDIRYVDFGFSELEILIEIITGIANGIRYNTSYFSHSSLPQGVLELIGRYKDEDFETFGRHWKAMTDGASGKWAVPVMGLEEGQGFKFTPFKNSNRDMEFNQFLEFLFNLACAVYQIDPNEVGFKSWTSKSGGMTQSDNTAEKIENSQDKGFVPLMNFLSNAFNSEIIDHIDEEFAFTWVGVDEQDEDKKNERTKAQLETGEKTVYMVWKENDVDLDEVAKQYGGELPKWAFAPANPQLIQVYMAESGLQQQGQQGAEGDPNAEGDEAQAQRDHELATADDGHKKQLELEDKKHENLMEQKKSDQDHQMKLEKMKMEHQGKMAKMMPKQPAGKDKLKKSLEPSEELEIEISWDKY